MLKKRAKIKKVIADIRGGTLLTHACKNANVSRETWRLWEKKKPRLERLRRAAEENCEDTRNKQVEDAFFKTLIGGKAHPISYIFYLTNRLSDRWKDKRAVSSASFVNKVDVNNAGKSPDELAEFKAKQGALLGRLAERLGI